MHFKIHPEIEYVNTLVRYEYDYNKVKLKLTRNMVIGYGISKDLVAMDTYNSLNAYNHKYLVRSGGEFMLVIYVCVKS